MSRKRFALGTALALLGLMAATPRADAAYSYTASLSITGFSDGGGFVNTPGVGATYTSSNGTVVTLGNINNPGSYLVGQPLSANVGNVGVTTTSAVPDTFSITYRIDGTLTEPFPGGPSITAQTTGVLTFTGIQRTADGAFGGTVSNQYTGPFTAGPGPLPDAVFFVSVPTTLNAMFGAPTIGGVNNGSLGALITSFAVPEPSSVAMMGLGIAGVAGVSLRRRRS